MMNNKYDCLSDFNIDSDGKTYTVTICYPDRAWEMYDDVIDVYHNNNILCIVKRDRIHYFRLKHIKKFDIVANDRIKED